MRVAFDTNRSSSSLVDRRGWKNGAIKDSDVYAYESGTGLYERFSRSNGRPIKNYAGAIGESLVLIAYKSGGRCYSPVVAAVYVSVRTVPILDAWPSASIPGEICDDLRRLIPPIGGAPFRFRSPLVLQ